MPRGGARPGAGRKPSAATLAIRAAIDDPVALRKAKARARKDPAFWFQLYQQIHGRPAQAVLVGQGEFEQAQDGSLTYRAVYGSAPPAGANGTNGHNGASNGKNGHALPPGSVALPEAGSR